MQSKDNSDIILLFLLGIKLWIMAKTTMNKAKSLLNVVVPILFRTSWVDHLSNIIQQNIKTAFLNLWSMKMGQVVHRQNKKCNSD